MKRIILNIREDVEYERETLVPDVFDVEDMDAVIELWDSIHIPADDQFAVHGRRVQRAEVIHRGAAASGQRQRDFHDLSRAAILMRLYGMTEIARDVERVALAVNDGNLPEER